MPIHQDCPQFDLFLEPSQRLELHSHQRSSRDYGTILRSLEGQLAVIAIIFFTAVPFSGIAFGQDSTELVTQKLLAGNYSRRGADTCLRCHDEMSPFPTTEIFRTVHGQPSHPGAPFAPPREAMLPAGLQCEACHGPLDEHGKQILADGEVRQEMLAYGGRGNVEASLQNSMCLNCHANYRRTHWEGSAHQSAGLACADCHQIHTAHDRVRSIGTQVDRCTTCHSDVAADILKRSSHPLRDSQLTCADCHAPHGDIGDHLTKHASVNDTCYTCHAEKRGPHVFEHPPASEDCTICHVPHGSNQPALLTRRPPQLCQGCHSSVGHRSMPQLASQLADGNASPFLIARGCLNCHSEVHGSNHPSGDRLRR